MPDNLRKALDAERRYRLAHPDRVRASGELDSDRNYDAPDPLKTANAMITALETRLAQRDAEARHLRDTIRIQAAVRDDARAASSRDLERARAAEAKQASDADEIEDTWQGLRRNEIAELRERLSKMTRERDLTATELERAVRECAEQRALAVGNAAQLADRNDVGDQLLAARSTISRLDHEIGVERLKYQQAQVAQRTLIAERDNAVKRLNEACTPQAPGLLGSLRQPGSPHTMIENDVINACMMGPATNDMIQLLKRIGFDDQGRPCAVSLVAVHRYIVGLAETYHREKREHAALSRDVEAARRLFTKAGS